jgi:hypothetical protein
MVETITHGRTIRGMAEERFDMGMLEAEALRHAAPKRQSWQPSFGPGAAHLPPDTASSVIYS